MVLSPQGLVSPWGRRSANARQKPQVPRQNRFLSPLVFINWGDKKGPGLGLKVCSRVLVYKDYFVVLQGFGV